MKKGISRLTLWSVVGIIFIFLLVSAMNESDTSMSYSDLITNIKAGKVISIEISADKASATVVLGDIEIESDAKVKNKANTKEVSIPSIENLMDELTKEERVGQIEIIQEEESILIAVLSLFSPFVILIVFLLFWLLLMNPNQSGNKSMTFGKSKARMLNTNDKNKITFKDVAGVDEEKEELQEIVDFLKSPKKFTDMGARIPKGVLLVGHPGTGKTLLAKAVAGEAGVPFFIISGSDFVEMFVGVGASRVRDLFEQAKRNSPCIIFIDEIDAVGRQRGAGLGGGHDEREQTLNQLLVEMDVDLSTIAKNTAGFAGADLENILNEAALLAARRDKTEISLEDIEDAMVKVTMGPEKKSRVISEKEKKLVAFHEAGHAVASHFLETQDDVHQISIIPRGMAGGYTMYRPSEDRQFMSKSEMEEQIISLLGGRVAESIVLGDISTGASNDIERASKIAREMVTKYGMSERLGTITFGSGQEEVFLGRDFTTQRNFSEETSGIIDEEVKRIIDFAYNKTEEILRTNIEKLHQVAGILLEKEKIDGEEFSDIMNS